MSYTETSGPSEPTFYYVLRDMQQDVVAVVTSRTEYSRVAHLGAYLLEPSSKAEVETLQEFDIVDTFDID